MQLAERLKKNATGVVVTMSDPAAVEIAAAAGVDFVWIDGEHGVIDRATAAVHLMAAEAKGLPTLYRVPACDHTEIKKVIDLGPDGIIVPMIMNEQDAAKAVSACRYPIHGGDRGCGFRRKAWYCERDTAEYLDLSKSDPLVILQLEHIDAYRRLDKILAVEGIGAILIGPYDFSMSMGKPGQFEDKEVNAAFDDAASQIKAKGLTLGVYCETAFDRWRARGVDFMAVKNDYNAMALGYKMALRAARGER